MEHSDFYKKMWAKNRGFLFTRKGRVVAVVTFLIGDDDNKYLYHRVPWQDIEDDSDGTTIYIDQLILKDEGCAKYIHREFSSLLQWIKGKFPNVKRAKWIRANAMFRKHGIKQGESNVHCKNIE